MSNRIKRRRDGKERASAYALGSTHVVKIGHKLLNRPAKLPGFLIHHNSVDSAGGGLLVDWDIMEKLGITPEMVTAAKKDELKATAKLLPTELRFVLLHDAEKKSDDAWNYPNTLAEEFECWNKEGRFCHGDGVNASRKIADRTTATIACVPVGSTGASAADFCPFSVKGECKCHSRLVLSLFMPGPDGRPEFLSHLGSSATFRLDTGSEDNSARFLSELDRGADTLDGHIQGLTGVLTYHIRKKRTGLKDQPVGTVGVVEMHLDELEIRRRAQQLHHRFLEERGLTQQIEAPEPVTAQDEIKTPIESTESPESQDAPVDIPRTPEPEPEPEPDDIEPDIQIAVADATVDELIEALDAHLLQQAENNGTDIATELGKIATYSYHGQTYPIDTTAWFRAGRHGKTTRVDILRATCERLAAVQGDGFVVMRRAEA